MSINTSMKDFVLQSKMKVRTASGAENYNWDQGRPIQAVVKKKSDRLNTQSVKYNESTHIGLTRCKYIKAHTNRLMAVDTGDCYDILSATNDGRITNLLLKRVDTDV